MMIDRRKRDGKKDDMHVVKLVVFFIGGFAIVGLIGIMIFLIVAILKDKPVEATAVALLTSLSTLCGTAIGSLGSMLNQTRQVDDSTKSVKVDQPPGEPIPVSDAGLDQPPPSQGV